MAAPAASTSTSTPAPAGYITYLVDRVDGSLVLPGPSFTGPDAADEADEWCTTHQTNRDETRDKWKVFALVPPPEPAPRRPTRAFLLPMQGEPRLVWLPPVRDPDADGPDAHRDQRTIMDDAVGGPCKVKCGWVGHYGDFSIHVDRTASCFKSGMIAANDAVSTALGERVLGPVLLVRNKLDRHKMPEQDQAAAAAHEDNADPLGEYLSIPAHIEPADWMQLLRPVVLDSDDNMNTFGEEPAARADADGDDGAVLE